MHNKAVSAELVELLSIRAVPIAISFVEHPPANVERILQSQPAGCAYWRLAESGKVFYTEAEDHYNCPIGAHTHGVTLPPERAEQLQGLISTMVDLKYLKLAEVAGIPRRQSPPGVIVYAPLSAAPCSPDIVLIRGNARQLMLLAEAAQQCGSAGAAATMGRPTCAILPQVSASQKTASSFGCIGNRVYTGSDDAEAYFAIPGAALDRVLDSLRSVAHANRQLEIFHRSRLSSAPASEV